MTNQEKLLRQHPEAVADFIASFDLCPFCQLGKYCQENNLYCERGCGDIIQQWLEDEAEGGGEDGN